MKGVLKMDFKKVFDFKQRIAELISLFKNFTSFDFLGRLKNILSDIPGLVALAGGTLMFIGAFIPNYWAGLWGINTYTNLFQAPWGVLIFILTLGMLGLAYFKQIFWAGLTSALCFTISLIQAIAFPAAIKIESGGWVDAGVHVGFFFVLLGELAIIGGFALHYFVMNKKAAQTPAIDATAAPVAEATATEAPVVEAPVAETVTEEVPAQAE